MVWNNYDCYYLIIDNISTIIKILKLNSNDSNKYWRIKQLEKALTKIPHKSIYSSRDFNNIKIAGPAIMKKITWIINNKRNLPEVDKFKKKKSLYNKISQDIIIINNIEYQILDFLDLTNPKIKNILYQLHSLKLQYNNTNHFR